MYSFSYLEPVCCSISSSPCGFLVCIPVSQGAGQGVWYSHRFQNFPQFIGIHTVKGFGIVNKAEIDVFLELSCLFHDPADVGNMISASSAFPKTSLNIWKFVVHVLLWPYELQHSRFPCPSSPRVCSNTCHWVSDAIKPFVLCHSRLPLPSVFPSSRVFSNESVFRIR